MTLRVAMLLVLVVEAAGCQKTWQSKVVQPRPELGNRTQRTSFPLVIRMSDMDLPRFCKRRYVGKDWSMRIDCQDMHLANTAYFVVVSKDRLRFHVTLHHKWESIADPIKWRVWVEDENGHRHHPEGLDRRHVKPVTQMWGTLGTDHKSPLLSITVWRGDGDFVFYEHDLFRRDMEGMTLVMERPGYTYRYEWKFVDIHDEAPIAARR